MNDAANLFLTEYFPAIHTMQKIYATGHIVIQTAENYQKNSLRNRCYIAGSQGKLLLSVPLVKGKNAQMRIRDVKISYDFDWRKQHIKAIKNNYLRSPFFDYYFPTIESILSARHIYLVDLNWESLSFMVTAFKLNKKMSCSLEFALDNGSIPFKTIAKPYPQLFEDKTGFVSDLSALDLLFCMGPEIKYLLPN